MILVSRWEAFSSHSNIINVMGRLDDKVTLITGAASGIGAAATRIFKSEGAEVVISDIQDLKFYYRSTSEEYIEISKNENPIGDIFLKIAQGTHDIIIKALNFHNYELNDSKYIKTLSYRLYISIEPPDNHGILILDSKPTNAEVIIKINNSTYNSKTPYKAILPIGTAKVKFIHPIYKEVSYEKDIEIKEYKKEKKETYYPHYFKLHKCSVSINVNPPTAFDAIVYINGIGKGKAPFHDSLDVGTYEVKLIKEGFTFQPLNIGVNINKSNVFDLSMKEWGRLIINLDDCILKVSKVHVNERSFEFPLQKISLPDSTYIIKLYNKKDQIFGDILTKRVPLDSVIQLTKRDFNIECGKEPCLERINKYKYQILGVASYFGLLVYTISEINSSRNAPKKIPFPPDFPK